VHFRAIARGFYTIRVGSPWGDLVRYTLTVQ
jgi:hypothetical protein